MSTTACDLTGRAALVTGASRGIGRAVATLLAKHGGAVAVHYRADAAAAATTVESLPGEGHIAIDADLADPRSALDLAGRAVAALGRLDIVVNNAGIYEPHAIDRLAADQWRHIWDRTLAVNLTGAVNVLHGAVGHLIAGGGGHVVNVSSRGAFRGEPDAPAYAASKAGLNAVSQSLAIALAPHGIVVVGVAPGWVATDMTHRYLDGPDGAAIRAQSPLGRVATSAEVAEAVLLAVSGNCDALTGAIIDVNCASYLR